MRVSLNARVKHREPFRPFAPAILQERAAEFFEIEQFDPFMTMAPRVRPDKATLIPAGIHVDGTARIQTVDRVSNPRFYGVIEKFAELTGVPVFSTRASICRSRSCKAPRMPSRASCARKWMCWCSAIFTLPTGTQRPRKRLDARASLLLNVRACNRLFH